MMGLLLLGENQTQDTYSKWLSFWTMYLDTTQSIPQLDSFNSETICQLSEEKATLSTSLVCPTNLHVVVAIVRSPR